MASKLDRSDPGCYHKLIEYLSQKTGISQFKEVIKKQVWKTSPHTGKKKLIYMAANIVVVDKKGNRHAFMKDQKRYDLRGIEADHFAVSVMRDSDEFGVKVNHAGNYRDSLGGGWYSNCSLLEVDGKYFATMECACGHNGYLVNPAVKDSVTYTMEPNNKQPDELKSEGEQATNAQESASLDAAMDATQDSEEGGVEG